WAPEAPAERSPLPSPRLVPERSQFRISTSIAQDLATSVAAETGCETNIGLPDPRGCELVINATGLGMNVHDALPLDPDRLEPGSVVVDIVNAPDPTPLCRAARARGCRTQSGRPMHEGQAVHAFRFLGFDYLPEGRSAPGHGSAPSNDARP